MPGPPWPFRSNVWRSPLRGPWLTSIFGAVLLLGFHLFNWPTRPIWLYRLNQGLHVTVGIALVPMA